MAFDYDKIRFRKMAIEKVGSAILFEFLCGVAGIIMGLTILTFEDNPSRMLRITAFMTLLCINACLAAETFFTRKENKIKIILLIITSFLVSFLFISWEDNWGGTNLAVNILTGILLLINSLAILRIAIPSWKSFSKKFGI